MKRAIAVASLAFVFLMPSHASDDPSKIEDFRQIGNDEFCAGASFEKNADDGSNTAGVLIYNAKSKNVSRIVIPGENNEYFSSYVHSCISNGKRVFLLQASETTPVGDSALQLTLHKLSKNNERVEKSKRFLWENSRVYPCSVDENAGKIVIEAIADKSPGGEDEHRGPFMRMVLSFDENLELSIESSKKAEVDEIFSCYNSKSLFLQSMFKSLITKN